MRPPGGWSRNWLGVEKGLVMAGSVPSCGLRLEALLG